MASLSEQIDVQALWRVVRDIGRMGRPSSGYRPKSPAQSVLYQVVHDHFETFRVEAARVHEHGLPRFIETEFRGFLRCGSLAGGFARFRCEGCGHDRLVPFSCKGRAVCSSCGGRRMAERAARLVDRVFPAVPVRQWVLSLPYRLRYVLAWDHVLCRAVTGVFVRAVLGSLRRRAAEGRARRARWGRRHHPTLWGCAEPERARACACARWRVCRGRARDAAFSCGCAAARRGDGSPDRRD